MKYILVCILVFSVGCTKAGETTYIASATGGVVGAGLGAIVGNQTGNAGAGIAIGALAGAGAGAAIGSAIEGQNGKISEQDEKIKRQERLIQSQRTELAEIRKANTGDLPVKKLNKPTLIPDARGSLATDEIDSEKIFEQSNSEDKLAAKKKEAEKKIAKMEEKNKSKKTDLAKKETKKKELEKKVEVAKEEIKEDVKEIIPQEPQVAKAVTADLGGSECQEADKESRSAEAAPDTADKLFHYRRALRLCPDNAGYHSALAKVYKSLNRNDDANFEMQEAKRLGGGE